MGGGGYRGGVHTVFVLTSGDIIDKSTSCHLREPQGGVWYVIENYSLITYNNKIVGGCGWQNVCLLLYIVVVVVVVIDDSERDFVFCQ